MTDVDNFLKDAFAAGLLRKPDDPFGVACALFGRNITRAMQVSAEWPYDIYVLTKQAELLATFGEEQFLPDRNELARRALAISEGTRTEPKDKLVALKLYGELRGYIEKGGGVSVNLNNTINNNKVITYKDFGTDDQWETKAIEQQTKLVAHARD